MKIVKNANGTYTLLADSDEENAVVNVIHELVGWSWGEMKSLYGATNADAILNNCGCYLPQFDDGTLVGGIDADGEGFIPED